MTSKGRQRQKVTKEPVSRGKQSKRIFSAQQKCQAVLSLWSEKRKPSELCREMGIKWASVNAWQEKALQAMMQALEPRSRKEEDRGPALGPKLEKLLTKTSQKLSKETKLIKRLEQLQENSKEE